MRLRRGSSVATRRSKVQSAFARSKEQYAYGVFKDSSALMARSI
jgi:hypothetical protein